MSATGAARGPRPEQLDELWRLLRQQRLVIVLGDDEGTAISPKVQWSEVGEELGFPGDSATADPALISKIGSLMYGRKRVQELLRELIWVKGAQAAPPTPLQQLIASLRQAPIIVTTALHDEIEQAFSQVPTPYHVVTYAASDEWAASVWYMQFKPGQDADAQKPAILETPSELDPRIDVQPLIYRVRGRFDQDAHESDIVVDEDDLAQYLVRNGPDTVVPAVIKQRFDEAGFLFIGFDLENLGNRLILQSLTRRFRARAWRKETTHALTKDLSSEVRATLQRILRATLVNLEVREQLLQEAFGDAERLRYGIDIDGTPIQVANRVINRTLGYGHVSDKDHALVRLLRVIERLRLSDDPAGVTALTRQLERVKLPDGGQLRPLTATVRNNHSRIERELWRSQQVEVWDMPIPEFVQAMEQARSRTRGGGAHG